MPLLPSRVLNVSIDRPPKDVYRFVTNPANMPKWATAFVKSARKEKGQWVIATPMGSMKVRFAKKNNEGVLDHFITTSTGEEIYSPMRVTANGSGSEVVFTLLRAPDMTDKMFAKDMGMIERDLRTLKDILEKQA